MQIGPRIDEIEDCECTVHCVLRIFSRFLDEANASSIPHLLIDLIMMIFFFAETIYLV